MNTLTRISVSYFCILILISLAGLNAQASAADGALEIYWTDVEGGAATLIVTPAGESILIDTGMPGDRDPARILDTIKNKAGLKKIDILVVTHFDMDHFGGTADIARQIEIDKIYDPGLPLDDPACMERIQPYLKAVGEKREVLRPGDTLPVKQTETGAPLEIKCLAAAKRFISPATGAVTPNPYCSEDETKDVDLSQNANSIVLLLSLSDFRFLDAADLTWNLEKRLVCPANLVGEVDVYQVDHHGLDRSNNPVLIKSIKPTVAVMNNGHKKGCNPGTFNTLTTTPSIKALYQMHRNITVGPEGNTDPKRIANIEQECTAEIIKLTVAPDGKKYTVLVPSTGLEESYATRTR